MTISIHWIYSICWIYAFIPMIFSWFLSILLALKFTCNFLFKNLSLKLSITASLTKIFCTIFLQTYIVIIILTTIILSIFWCICFGTSTIINDFFITFIWFLFFLILFKCSLKLWFEIFFLTLIIKVNKIYWWTCFFINKKCWWIKIKNI